MCNERVLKIVFLLLFLHAVVVIHFTFYICYKSVTIFLFQQSFIFKRCSRNKSRIVSLPFLVLFIQSPWLLIFWLGLLNPIHLPVFPSLYHPLENYHKAISLGIIKIIVFIFCFSCLFIACYCFEIHWLMYFTLYFHPVISGRSVKKKKLV